MESENKYIGRKIGNYRITAPIGAGAFGSVYKGVHVILSSRTVAIKLMHNTNLASEHERESFLQEAQFLELLKHPHILPIYDVGVDEGTPYIIAEFAPNGSLRDLMKHQAQLKQGLFSLEKVLTIISQVGQALDYVHKQNYVHRDLKPENILFDAQNDALIADFGIAVFLESTKTQTVDVIGSPRYMAPEQFEGFVSRRSDQYALACITYELLTGRPPFTGQHAVTIAMAHQTKPPLPPTEINAAVPSYVEQALLRALSKKREDRFPDITSFLTSLLDLHIPSIDPSASGREISIPLSISTPNVAAITLTKEQWVEEGNTLYDQGKFQEALNAFEYAIQKDPTFAYAHEGKTSALFALGNYQDAMASVETALSLDPTYAPSYNDKAMILYELHCYEDALTYYKKSIEIDPAYLDGHLGLATALSTLRRYPEALLAYDQAILADESCAPAYNGKAWILRQLQRSEEALSYSEKAIQLDPQTAEHYTGKGRALFRLGRYDESLAAFDQAIQLDATHSQTYDYKADTLYHMRRFNEALSTYEYAYKLDPQRASSYEGKANVLFNFGQYQEALATYEIAIKLEPRNGSFLRKKADTLKALGQTEEAEQVYEQVQKLEHGA
ncbi:serine/threonine-protein kinase [Tengunoibacter tsumagoiensis]|uniref:Protein kinase domain-containing protein n=1 Tax=Tengunoibacter tsumagoiensis TaxID=2014871 RepID=A0A402A4D5_9CHLR|nr:serine/threonine-protein kinase [Tengunoibacter tsumagoiensis]GCE13972.1 hypothetical protein KTT_38310 [Tengunoibacter tsumagoiensis]